MINIRFSFVIKKESATIEKEYHKLDNALAYWGEQELHDILKKWYDQIKEEKIMIPQKYVGGPFR